MNVKRRHLAAIAATVVFHAAVVTCLLCGIMRYDAAGADDRQWPPVDSSEILFADEYVLPEPQLVAEAGAAEGQALPSPAEQQATTPEPEPTAPAPPPVVATKHESPAKASTTPDRAKERADREAEASAISSRVSFGGGKKGNGEAHSGEAKTGLAGVSTSGLGNRAALSLPQPKRGPMGRIIIKVSVNREGNVTQASYLSGEGAAAADGSLRNSCVAAARKARFQASPEAPASQTGTIVYNFK